MPVILDSFFRKIGDFRAWYFGVEKFGAFLDKWSFSCSFFAQDYHKIDDFFTLFNAISKVNPANLLCRTVVG